MQRRVTEVNIVEVEEKDSEYNATPWVMISGGGDSADLTYRTSTTYTSDSISKSKSSVDRGVDDGDDDGPGSRSGDQVSGRRVLYNLVTYQSLTLIKSIPQ